MDHSSKFIWALENNDIETIRQIPKSDLHNHFVLGGSRAYIKSRTGFDIWPITKPLFTMDQMHNWSDKNMGARFDTEQMRRLLIEAAFVQAKQDGVTVLEIVEDVWALATYFHNDIDELIDAFKSVNDRIAPHIELRLQIGLSRHCSIEYLQSC